MSGDNFSSDFQCLTGHLPFPWQERLRLYERFIAEGKDNIPAVASIPTGLGKTNVIAVWLLALLKLREQPAANSPRNRARPAIVDS